MPLDGDMSEQFHIIITGERGKVRSFPCSRKRLRLFTCIATLTIAVLSLTSFYSISLYSRNSSTTSELADLREKLRTSAELIAEQNRKAEEQRLRLSLKVTSLELNNVKQAVAFRDEKEALLSNAVSELNERSELIEQMIGSIGIELPKEEKGKTENSGGPFIKSAPAEQDELLYRADRYLKTIRFLPFGRPVDGIVTSRYGKRKDPMNKKSAFHPGIDFRGKRGEKVYATADGVVRRAFRNGGYGKYIQINHGNGYTTAYAHLQTILVKKGEKISRGQLIGLVGNTGRSTGPHLHYEIALNGKHLNPYSFIKIANTKKKTTSVSERR